MRPTRPWKVTAVAAVLAITSLAACDPPPPPKVLVVTNQGSADGPDATPGDGICRTAGVFGGCTLRAAIQEANASHVDRIEVLAGGWYRITSSLAVDPVAPSVAIVPTGTGTGPAWIEATAAVTGAVFDVDGGGLSVTRTRITAPAATSDGLRIDAGASAVLSEVEVDTGSDAVTVSGGLVVNRSDLHDGGGAGVVVGGTGVALVLGSSIRGNAGAGLDVAAGGSATVTSSTVSGNAIGVDADGSVDLSLATVAANTTAATAGTGTVEATGSIVVQATGGAGCTGTFSSSGWNGVGNGCGPLATDVAVGPDALLPLTTGASPHHPISATGAALHDLVAVGDGPCTATATDQRGATRAGDGSCDAGAYEGPTPVAASSWTVDTPTDVPDAEPGDGWCETLAGDCTLRAAMAEAALASASGPVPQVSIAAGIDPVLADDAPLPADRVTVLGGGATVDADGGYRGFSHCEGTTRFEDLTITGSLGTAIASGCADFDPDGRIELDGVTLTGNGTGVTGDSYTGNLRLFVHDSDISDNDGSGIGEDFTQVVVTSSRLTGNGDGGIGLGEQSSSISVTDSLISGNRFGISIQYGGVTVTRSLVADHAAAAIYTSAGGVQIVDSTISGNGVGVSEGFDGSTTFRRSTVVDNGVAYQSFDGFIVNLTLAGSVIQGGVACQPGNDTTIVSEGWNVISDTSCGLTGTADQQGVDALLGPLADNGGPTLTHLPAAGSPAIDAVPTGTANLCTGTLVDQRGTSRPQGTACDRGAVEQ